MGLKITPKQIIKGDDHGIAVRVPTDAYKRLTKISRRTGYSRGELIAMAVAELSVVTKSEQGAD